MLHLLRRRIIIDDEPDTSNEIIINRYAFFMLRLDIESTVTDGDTVISMLASTLCDQMFAPERAIRHIEFDVEPGKINLEAGLVKLGGDRHATGTAWGRADGVSLGSAKRNYELGAPIRDLPLTEGNPQRRDPAIYTDHDVRFRQVICPETARILQTEAVVDGAEPRWDLRPGTA